MARIRMFHAIQILALLFFFFKLIINVSHDELFLYMDLYYGFLWLLFSWKKVVVILLCPWKMAFSFFLTEWLSLSF